MGQADWNNLNDSISAASLARGVTAGIQGPAGGNGFVYGYNSLDGTVSGAHGKYVDLSNFAPTGTGLSVPDGGGSVRGCVQRTASPNNTGFTPMLFFCAQGGPPSVNDAAYILGLSDADPYEIVLAKAPIVSGIVDSDENVTILRRSSAQYAIGDNLWHHLRLDAIVEPNGDVLLKCFSNDLAQNPIGSAPDWQTIQGISDFIDDAIQINTGSAPLWGGYMGFAFTFAASLNRRGAFDALEAYRTT
jgi:hypothetical protein